MPKMPKKVKENEKKSLVSSCLSKGKRGVKGKQRPLNNFERTIRAVKASDSTELQSQYGALLGLARPPEEVMVCNEPILKALVRGVAQAAKAHASDAVCPIGLQIVRVAVSPGSEAKIDVVAARKCVALYKKMSPDVICAVRVCPIPSLSDPYKFDMATDLAVLFFGNEVGSPFRRSIRRSRAYREVRQSDIRWVDVNDKTVLRSAVKELLMPPYMALPAVSLFDDPPKSVEWAEDSNKGLRRLVTLMCRSQLPLKRMVHATGAGKHVVAGPMTAAEHALKQQCKTAPAVLHRDEIPHFWFAELRRLGFDDISVPFMKLR